MRRLLLSLLGIFMLTGSLGAAPAADAWRFWEPHDAASTQTLDHAPWTRLLESYRVSGADGVARFAYGRVTRADRSALQAYLAALQAVAVRGLARPEQMAYWINLYNAATIETVLAHYPVASIRDIRISPGLFSSGPWGRKFLRVEGQELSLDDIEHRILRPFWRDPRIHYAVNCASIGCPDLAPQAFTAATLVADLDRAARGFVGHPRAVRIERGRLVLSSIYDWFKEDFGGNAEGLRAHLLRYAQGDVAAALASGVPIASYSYDWSLNDARP
jgi:hypothetical protein